jgi:hypothetical protein
MMFVLKYGSSSMLFMAQTILLPIGNLVFALPIMPQATALHVSDVLGLIVIMFGLIMYKFMDDGDHEDEPRGDSLSLEQLGITPWLQDMMQHLREPLVENGTTPWFQDLVRQLREPQQSGPWFQDVIQHLREPLIQCGDV